MFTGKNSWIEQIYQYIEHYYWYPQELNKQSTNKGGKDVFREVQAKMRSYKVPLNAIFNITLRLLPSRIQKNLLSLFVKSTFGQQFALIDVFSAIPEMGNFIQPDIAIETENSRIFIETKINTDFDLQKTYKYIFLHAWLNQKTGYKRPFLLYLSSKVISEQWKSTEKNQIFTKDKFANSLLMYLNKQNFPISLGDLKSTEFLHEDARKVIESLTIGSATWHEVGNYFNQELESLDQKSDDSQEVISKLISDFLTELKNRNLYNSSKAEIMNIEWYGITKSETLNDCFAKIRHELADAAKTYNWQLSLEILKANPNLINSTCLDGTALYTPLHQAALFGAPIEVVEQLLAIGAWRTLRNALNERPVDIAIKNGHHHLVALLEPIYKRQIPLDTIQSIQKHFHNVILGRASKLVKQHSLLFTRIRTFTRNRKMPSMVSSSWYEGVDLIIG